jgi:hypothetical protein
MSRYVSSGMLVCLTALLLSPSRTVLFLAGFHLLWRLGTSRIYEQHRLESPAQLADLRGLETGLQNGAQGIAVPVVMAHAARCHGDQRAAWAMRPSFLAREHVRGARVSLPA